MTGWQEVLVYVASIIVGGGAGGGGLWVWLKGRKDRSLTREEDWIKRFEARVAELEARLDAEEQGRERDRRDYYRVLNAFRLREGAWLGVWREMGMKLIGLGGTVDPLPVALQTWPDDIQHLHPDASESPPT